MQLVPFEESFAGHCLRYYGLQVEPPKPLKAPKKKKLTWDAVSWKSNDQYALLGLEERRQEATFDEIRSAYRRAVLLHHPDKQAQRKADNHDDDSLFKCIQKAFDVLSDPERRQQYDSVDFDESVPKAKDYSEDDFFHVFPEVFARNARFSMKLPVPVLTRGMTRPDAEDFYVFWFNFESWRRFEFLDEEDAMEMGGERAEKRYIDKKNKAARAKRKTEDNARVSRLVELAYKMDPRIRRYKEEDRLAKEAKKKASTPSPVLKGKPVLSPSKAADDEKKRKEEQIKQAMQAAKEAAAEAKLQKRSFRALFTDNAFFSRDNDPKEMERVALLMEQCTTRLSTLELRDLEAGIKENLPNAIRLTESALGASTKASSAGISEPPRTEQSTTAPAKEEHEWTTEQIDLLIRTVKQFPPGVADRWATIAEHINRYHSIDSGEVLRKAEEVKASRQAGAVVADSPSAVPVPKKRDPRVDQAEPTILVREDTPNAAFDAGQWTADEQGLLETAMKTHGPDTDDRWARVAECLPDRSKTDVMRRVKEIADRLKRAKK